MGRCDDRGCSGSDDNDESTQVRWVEHDWMRWDGSTSDTEWVSWGLATRVRVLRDHQWPLYVGFSFRDSCLLEPSWALRNNQVAMVLTSRTEMLRCRRPRLEACDFEWMPRALALDHFYFL